MGYSNNTNKLPLSAVNDLYSDGCGNTYNDKYYVNGAYIDLCGLPIEEYMKNPYCCGGGSGPGSDSDEPVKIENPIYVKVFEDENGIIYYQAFSKFPSASNIKISVKSGDETITELDLYAGETETKQEVGITKEFINVALSMEEDDFYSYVVKTDGEKMVFDIFIGTIHLNESNSFTDNLETFSMNIGSSTDIVYTIPGTDINYNEMEDMEEFDKFCLENQFCFILCLPKEIYNKNQYSIFNYGGSDITKKFVFVSAVMVNDEEYVYLRESSTDDIMPYVPLYNEDIVYEYKLTLNN